jgi:hypothetical protein
VFDIISKPVPISVHLESEKQARRHALTAERDGGDSAVTAAE